MVHLKRLGRALLWRIVELMREVGMLIIALAPLDAVIANETKTVSELSQFFKVGVVLFLGSVILEWAEGFLRPGGLHDR